MGQNLTGQTIASTYEDLVQISGSSRNFLTDGTGSDITSLNVTASFANTATSASHAVTASFALNATVNTGSLLTTASISNATTTYTKGDGSTFNLTVNNVSNASTASYVATAIRTGSVAQNTLTFTKFDGSTFALTVDTGSGGVTPNLQQVTTAGNITSQSIQVTDATTGNTIVTQTTVALNSVDNTTPLEVNFTDNNGLDTSGVRFTPSTFALDIFTYNNAPISLKSGTQVTGSLNVSGGITGSLLGTATSASYVASAIQTGSVSSNVLTFTKFDGSTFNLTVNTGSGGGASVPSGLISGSAPRSLISANYQPTASAADGTGSIAIGNNVRVDSTNLFALGTNITSSGGSNTNTVVLGATNTLQGNCSDNVLIGNNLFAQNGKNQTVYIGSQPGNEFVNQESVAIGYNAGAAAGTVAIGWGASGGNDAVNIGKNSNLGAQGSVTIGTTATSLGNNAVTLGYGAANSAGNGAITIGTGQTTGVANEINIGGKFRFNSGSNGIIELRDDVTVSGSITATLSSSVQSDVVYYNSTTGLFTYGAPAGGATPNLQEVTTAGNSTSQSITVTDTTTAFSVVGGNYYTINSIDNSTIQYVNFTDNNGFDFSGVSFNPANFELDIYTYNNARIRLDGPTQVTGSLRGEVNALTISSNTASLDCATGNFFTLQLVSGSNTYINPSNVRPGQTISLRVNTTGSGTVSFPSSVKQASGLSYTPTTTTGVDIVTFVSFDSTDLYLSNIKNLV